MSFDNRFLSSSEFIQDPYPTYHYLRENHPVHWMEYGQDGKGMWLFTRYEDALQLFKAPAIIKDVRRVRKVEEAESPLGRTMLDHDPPEHTRLRSLVNGLLTLLAFGQGPHFCVGAPLSRAEARIAFKRILPDMASMRLAQQPADWREMTWMRGLWDLPVVYN